jgi:hypothetical protein
VIENELQYDLTRAAAERFERALAELGRRSSSEDEIHPLLRKAQEDSIHSELEVLQAQLREYESRRSSARATGQPARQID